MVVLKCIDWHWIIEIQSQSFLVILLLILRSAHLAQMYPKITTVFTSGVTAINKVDTMVDIVTLPTFTPLASLLVKADMAIIAIDIK